MAFEHVFRWPHSEPSHVVVTGTFDNWSSSVTLQKNGSEGFSGTVKLPYDSTVLYKYVVDGNWLVADSQDKETDGSGNVNNVLKTPSQPAAAPTASHSADPAAPLKDVADTTEAPNTQPVTEVLAAAAGAAAVAGGAAVAAISSALGGQTQPVSTATPEGAPINNVSLPSATPAEKPAEPAPTPAVLNDSKSQTSLPTVPSEQDVRNAVGSSEPKEPVLGGLAPIADQKQDSKLTSVEASGKNASTAGPADGQPALRLTEVGAGAAAVAGGAAAAVAAGGSRAHSDALPAPISNDKYLEPVKGVEVYGKDGSVGKDADISVPKPEKGATAAAGAGAGAGAAAVGAGADAAAAAAAAGAKSSSSSTPTANELKVHNPKTGQLEPATGPNASTAAPSTTSVPAAADTAKKPSKVPAPTPSTPSKEAPVTPKKAEKPASGQKYNGLGHAKDTSKASTVSKKSVGGADSSPNTPAKEEYKTAPSTPAPDTPGGLKPGERQTIPRTSSFFGKIKASLSPSKKK